MPKKSYIKEFEGLRGLLACWVALGHALVALPVGASEGRGALFNVDAVDVFIILSGFVIFSLLDGDRKTSYFPYLIARFFRIFPVYFLVLIISTALLGFDRQAILTIPHGTATPIRLTLIAAAESHPVAHFIGHLTMLHGAIPEHLLPRTAFTLVGQAWSISVEWQFYLIAPFLFAWFSTIERLKSLVAVTAVAGASYVYGHFTTNGFAGNNCLLFGLGFASYYFYRSDCFNLSPGAVRVVFAAAFYFSFFLMREHIVGVTVWLAVFYAVVAARQAARGNLINRALMLPPVAYVGRISYSLYMVHMQVLYLLMEGFHLAHFPLWFLPPTVLVVSVGVASLVHHTIEAPLHGFGKRLSMPRRLTPAAAVEGSAP